MTKDIFWILEVQINDGNDDSFRALMEKMIGATKQEPGTKEYQWFISENKCHIFERYQDDQATLVHIQNFGTNFAKDFMSLCTPKAMTVYGSPSEQVTNALAGLEPTYISQASGFSR